MPSLKLSDHVHVRAEIVNAVLARGDDRRAFVFTPADPLPARRIGWNVSGDHTGEIDSPDTTAQWVQDSPTFDAVKRVENWGWLRRIACGYSEPGLVHPYAGAAFEVIQWRYGKTAYRHECFDPVFIARLSDGRIFADQWASPRVLLDALKRWRNAQGYALHWEGIGFSVFGAIGGQDFATISTKLDEHHARVMRERARTETEV